MFINLSNHNSDSWSEEQIHSAKCYGDIVDMDFPGIDAKASEEEIASLADQFATIICSNYALDTDVIHIMGEMTFTYALVKRLREAGFRCVASTTERVKRQLPDGSFISEFKFQMFRLYE